MALKQLVYAGVSSHEKCDQPMAALEYAGDCECEMLRACERVSGKVSVKEESWDASSLVYIDLSWCIEIPVEKNSIEDGQRQMRPDELCYKFPRPGESNLTVCYLNGWNDRRYSYILLADMKAKYGTRICTGCRLLKNLDVVRIDDKTAILKCVRSSSNKTLLTCGGQWRFYVGARGDKSCPGPPNLWTQ